jgi:hypothetical protein
VVSLAAALALPAEFPSRDLILFLAFCAILATLVLQGTTLGPLIRRMGLDEPEDESLNPAVTPDAINARSEATIAAMAAVREKIDDADPEQAAVAGDLLHDPSFWLTTRTNSTRTPWARSLRSSIWKSSRSGPPWANGDLPLLQSSRTSRRH